MTTEKTIFVYADWQPGNSPVLMGQLVARVVRGKEVLAFEYAAGWLDQGDPNLLMDPQLQLVAGAQHAPALFGIFLDSAPDRWGRVLIERREAYRAKVESRRAGRLFDTDYLLAVADVSRMGALRFKLDPDGPFLDDSGTLAIPPIEALRKLEQASLAFEQADIDDPEYVNWLRLLLAPGTSLGGARPKGSVIDTEGTLWIAKFPSRNDSVDVGAWEWLTYTLAKEAGLRVVESRGERFSRAGTTFMVQRFDRHGERRVHYASAMTLLGYVDGENHTSGASYLDLVELISRQGESVESDLEELWRRIVFNIFVGNADDHLRNHGFLLGERGWRLSPVFDLNPQPWAQGLSLNIDERSNALDLELVSGVGEWFRLSEARRNTVVGQVRKAVAQWERIARSLGLSRQEIEVYREVFERFA